jgi:hypothetical protein
MLYSLQDIAEGQNSEHKADVQLGQILADKHIRPLLHNHCTNHRMC